MISHKHKCIFVHIPKCAGTSVETALGHLEGHEGRNGQDHRSLRMIEPYFKVSAFSTKENMIEIVRRKRHQYFAEVTNSKNKYLVTKEQYENYFKFTVIRNPWSRALSWYRNVMRDRIHQEMLGISEDMPFYDFLIQFAGKGMLSPQLYWVKSFDGSIQLDYIARFENLSEDILKIYSQLGIQTKAFPHEKVSTKVDYRTFYSNAENDLILSHYAEEIDVFGYTFDSGTAKNVHFV